MIDLHRLQNPDYPLPRGGAVLVDATGYPFAPDEMVRAGPSLCTYEDLQDRDLRVLQIRRLKQGRRETGLDQLILAIRPYTWFAASHFVKAPEPISEPVVEAGPWELWSEHAEG